MRAHTRAASELKFSELCHPTRHHMPNTALTLWVPADTSSVHLILAQEVAGISDHFYTAVPRFSLPTPTLHLCLELLFNLIHGGLCLFHSNSQSQSLTPLASLPSIPVLSTCRLFHHTFSFSQSLTSSMTIQESSSSFWNESENHQVGPFREQTTQSWLPVADLSLL